MPSESDLPPGVVVEALPKMLTITYSEEPETRYDVSELLKLEGIAQPVARSFARVLASMSVGRSRRTKFKDLKYGYLKFISELQNPPTDLSGLSRTHVRAFIAWLGSAKSARTGSPLTKGNRIHKLGSLADTLRKLSREYPEVDVSELVPPNPWATEVSARNVTAPLSIGQQRRLLQHVEGALKPIIEWADRAFPSPAHVGKAGETVVADMPHVIERLVAKWGYIPQKSRLRSEASLPEYLRRAVCLDQLVSLAGPTSRQAHLAYVYILIYTAFNEQPLRDLCLSEIEVEDIFGFKRTLISAEKIRSRGTVRRVFHDDPGDKLSVFRVIDVLKRWTSLLRSIAPPPINDSLFLFLPRNRTQDYPVGSFSGADRRGEVVFRNCTSALSKQVGHKYIGTRAIRASGAQILSDFNNGDLSAVSRAMGHANAATTDNSYRSVTWRDKEQWKLAGVMLQRERYLTSGGTVDPRGARGMIETTGATPGWVCIDNLSSPIEGQREGFPCTAYPLCPGCPHSQPHPDRSYFLARVIQLFGKIQEAVGRQGSKAALARYGHLLPYLAGAKEWIRDEDTTSRAATLKLSPLPDLD